MAPLAGLEYLSCGIEALNENKPSALKADEFEAYKVSIGSFTSQLGLLLPPGADPKLVATLRKVMVAVLKSDQAKTAANKAASFDTDFIDRPSAEKVLAVLRSDLNAAPKVKAMMQKIMATKKKKKQELEIARPKLFAGHHLPCRWPDRSKS